MGLDTSGTPVADILEFGSEQQVHTVTCQVTFEFCLRESIHVLFLNLQGDLFSLI